MVVGGQFKKPDKGQIQIAGESALMQVQKRDKSKASDLGEIRSDNKMRNIKRVNPSPSVGALPIAGEHSPTSKQSALEIGSAVMHHASRIDNIKSHHQLATRDSQEKPTNLT